jgi:hypothetical protein
MQIRMLVLYVPIGISVMLDGPSWLRVFLAAALAWSLLFILYLSVVVAHGERRERQDR